MRLPLGQNHLHAHSSCSLPASVLKLTNPRSFDAVKVYQHTANLAQYAQHIYKVCHPETYGPLLWGTKQGQQSTCAVELPMGEMIFMGEGLRGANAGQEGTFEVHATLLSGYGHTSTLNVAARLVGPTVLPVAVISANCSSIDQLCQASLSYMVTDPGDYWLEVHVRHIAGHDLNHMAYRGLVRIAASSGGGRGRRGTRPATSRGRVAADPTVYRWRPRWPVGAAWGSGHESGK